MKTTKRTNESYRRDTTTFFFRSCMNVVENSFGELPTSGRPPEDFFQLHLCGTGK